MLRGDQVRATVAAATLVALALLGCVGDRSSDREAVLDRVAKVFAGTRLFAVRLSIVDRYVSCGADMDPAARCGDVPDPVTVPVADMAAELTTLASARPDDAEVAHARALWDLAWADDASDLARPVAALERLAEARPDDARVIADLAAAHLLVALRERDASALVASIERGRHALEAAPEVPAARFNLALAYEAAGLFRSAAAEWARYLATGPDTGWAEEARARASGVGRRDRAAEFAVAIRSPSAIAERARSLARDYPALLQEHLLEVLIPSWAEALLARDATRAGVLLAATRGVAEALAAESGDLLGVRALEHLEAEIAAGRLQIARGAVDLERGRSAMRAQRDDEAVARLGTASRTLAAAGSPLALMPEVWLAYVDIRYARYDEARRRLARLLEAPAVGEARAAHGRIHWYLGLADSRQGRESPALASFRRALASFEAGRYARDAGAIHFLMAEKLDELAPPRVAWESLTGSLRALADYPAYSMLHSALVASARAAIDARYREAALAFLEESAALQEFHGRALSAAERNHWIARVLRLQGRTGAARVSLDAAISLVEELPAESANRERLSRDNALELALLSEETDADAAKRLDELVAYYRRIAVQFKVVEASVGASLIVEAAGDREGAERRAREALASEVRQNHELSDPAGRLIHAGLLRPLFERTLALAVPDAVPGEVVPRRNAAEDLATLGLSEQMRLLGTGFDRAPNALIASASTGRGDAPAADRVPAWELLGRDEIVVVFQQLDDRLARWVLSREGVRATVLPHTAARLDRQRTRLVRALRAGDELAARAAGATLYDVLLRGLSPDTWARVTLVPDARLAGVPLAALVNPVTDRYLVEETVPALSVSALPAVASCGPLQPRSSGVLLVGDPAFDRSAYSWLGRLPGSRDEVEMLARTYGVSALVGEAATPAAFLDGMRRAEVLHYAGHALASVRSDFDSRLLLAPGRDSVAGELTVDRLYELASPSLRLVVLSACSTVASGSGAGILGGIAAPFIAAGADAVVGTLWQANDATAVTLMESFHAALRAGAMPAEALARAQRAMLGQASDSDAPLGRGSRTADWSAFTVVRRAPGACRPSPG